MKDGAALAKINLDAAKYCESKSAFFHSLNLLQRGLEYLNTEDKWLENFELSMEMTESLAKMEFVVGSFDACKVTIKEILLRANSTKTKVKVVSTKVETHSTKMIGS
eukprot:CAMPEP_0194160982 /NCGR_PEP_ID=MMETSP0152-20130528/78691_1 /TAXON_ID=1049557 /ORGANISM="Thalassiothrix antarctica, Strain L6-D1" /LENGTH=106 /DNA_ID=CAMNT_0038870727 /DNA_START=1372 /DNA_END=1695 /DNA_ORIENTATION=+